jgi:hypothetical protein
MSCTPTANNMDIGLATASTDNYTGSGGALQFRNIQVYQYVPVVVTAEGNAAHRARVKSQWDIAPYWGTKRDISYHLTCAGFPNTHIGTFAEDTRLFPCYPTEPNFRPNYRTQFAIYFPGPHPVYGPAKPWGSFKWGDGTLWGCQADAAGLATIRSIVRQRKPADWICTDMLFQLPGSVIHIPF